MNIHSTPINENGAEDGLFESKLVGERCFAKEYSNTGKYVNCILLRFHL